MNKTLNKELNMKITEQVVMDVIDKKISLDMFNKQEQEQIFNMAFGEEFMRSNDKGAKKKYKEIDNI